MDCSQDHSKNVKTDTCFVNKGFVHVHQLEQMTHHYIHVAEDISNVIKSKQFKPEVTLILTWNQSRKSRCHIKDKSILKIILGDHDQIVLVLLVNLISCNES